MTTEHGRQSFHPLATRISSEAKTWLNSQPLPHCPALLEKLIDTQLVNEFLTFFQHRYSQQTTTVHCLLQDTSSPNLSDLLFKIHIFPSMPGSSKCYLSFKFSNLNFVCSIQFSFYSISSSPLQVQQTHWLYNPVTSTRYSCYIFTLFTAHEGP
jgi:hypothetical protein